MTSSTPIPEHLAPFQTENYADAWDARWEKGHQLFWDEGFPNPALEDALAKQKGTIGQAMGQDAQGRPYRRKALVPGCGRGVDVLLLASFGFDAYGLEYSAHAIEACKKEEKENHSWYRVRDQAIGQGSVTWVQGDFFADDWLQRIGVSGGFDLIYDYTVRIYLPARSCSPFLTGQYLLTGLSRSHTDCFIVLLCLESPNASKVGTPSDTATGSRSGW